MLELDHDRSRNVRLEDLEIVEGSLRMVEVDALEEAHIEGGEDSAVLARFDAFPLDPDQEMHMEWKYAIEVGFSEDRLPSTLQHLGGVYGANVVSVLWGIVPDIREVFRALAPFLPAEPPTW